MAQLPVLIVYLKMLNCMATAELFCIKYGKGYRRFSDVVTCFVVANNYRYFTAFWHLNVTLDFRTTVYYIIPIIRLELLNNSFILNLEVYLLTYCLDTNMDGIGVNPCIHFV